MASATQVIKSAPNNGPLVFNRPGSFVFALPGQAVQVNVHLPEVRSLTTGEMISIQNVSPTTIIRVDSFYGAGSAPKTTYLRQHDKAMFYYVTNAGWSVVAPPALLAGTGFSAVGNTQPTQLTDIGIWYPTWVNWVEKEFLEALNIIVTYTITAWTAAQLIAKTDTNGAYTLPSLNIYVYFGFVQPNLTSGFIFPTGASSIGTDWMSTAKTSLATAVNLANSTAGTSHKFYFVMSIGGWSYCNTISGNKGSGNSFADFYTMTTPGSTDASAISAWAALCWTTAATYSCDGLDLDFEVTATSDYTISQQPGSCFYYLLQGLIAAWIAQPDYAGNFPARVSCEVAGSATKRNAPPLNFAGSSGFRRNNLMLYDSGSPQTYPVLFSANEFLTDGWTSYPSQLGFGLEVCPQAVTPPDIGPYTIDPYVAGTYTSWARMNGFGEVFVWVMDCTSPPDGTTALPTTSIALSLYQMFIQEIVNAMLLNPPAAGNYPVVLDDADSLFYLYTMSSPPNVPIKNNINARPPLSVGTSRNGQLIVSRKIGAVKGSATCSPCPKPLLCAIKPQPPKLATVTPPTAVAPPTTVTPPASGSKSDSAKSGAAIAVGLVLIALLVAVTTWACTKTKQ